jgi:hypothetical protein
MNDKAKRALKRLLANGPLTAVPKRPADQQLLVDLAAARFDARSSYLEREVNDELKAWLETISEPFGIDHVTLRRLLVDARLLTRTNSGSMYRLNPEKMRQVEAVREIDPAGVLAGIRNERDQRKRQRAT